MQEKSTDKLNLFNIEMKAPNKAYFVAKAIDYFPCRICSMDDGQCDELCTLAKSVRAKYRRLGKTLTMQALPKLLQFKTFQEGCKWLEQYNQY